MLGRLGPTPSTWCHARQGMQVLIIGVDHQLQQPGQTTMSAQVSPGVEQRDKDRFVQLLRDNQSRAGAALIAEECYPGVDTLPRRVAVGLGIRHECIEMSLSERALRNIPADYHDDPSISLEQKNAFDSQREQFMACRMEEVSCGLDSIIVACGTCHMAGLAMLISRNGHTVLQHDVLTDRQFNLSWLRTRLSRLQTTDPS